MSLSVTVVKIAAGNVYNPRPHCKSGLTLELIDYSDIIQKSRKSLITPTTKWKIVVTISLLVLLIDKQSSDACCYTLILSLML